MIEYGTCQQHPNSASRDGQCLECRPTERYNLNGMAPFPSVMARIATMLETWGKLEIVHSAISDAPGSAAMLLGIEVGKKESEDKS